MAVLNCCWSPSLSLPLCVCLDACRRDHTIYNGCVCIWNKVSQVADLHTYSMGYVLIPVNNIIHGMIDIISFTSIGTPLFIVAISAGIRHDLYGTDS